MPNVGAWIQRMAVVATVLMSAFPVQAVWAQDAPPAKVPAAPEAGAVKGDQPQDVPADRKARMEDLRARWKELQAAFPERGNTIQMAVQGEYVYILYGTYLCQLSAETLELKAKVNLRDVILGDRALLRGLRRNRLDARPKPDAPQAEQPAAPPGPPQPQ